jgi:hypothetical protein
MRPAVQLWVPLLSGSPYVPETQRDMARAYRAWDGEDRIYLLPWIKKPFGFGYPLVSHTPGNKPTRDVGRLPYEFRVLAIPSEQLEIVDIIHIDSDRHVFAPGLPLTLFLENVNVAPKQMYLRWINTPEPHCVPSPGVAEFEVPFFEGGRVVFRRITPAVEPGPIVPVTSVDPTGKMEVVWPPPQSEHLQTISPEAESTEFYGRLRFADQESRVVVTENDPEMRAIHVSLKWPPPFDQCFPWGGGSDLSAELAKMRHLATKGASVSAVRLMLQPYLSCGKTTYTKSRFWPLLSAEGESNALTGIEIDKKLSHESVRELFADPEYRRIEKEEISIERIWGWQGYFWFEFLNDLLGREVSRQCEKCGRVIGGTERKRVCNKTDNPDCYRARRTQSRRSARARR